MHIIPCELIIFEPPSKLLQAQMENYFSRFLICLTSFLSTPPHLTFLGDPLSFLNLSFAIASFSSFVSILFPFLFINLLYVSLFLYRSGRNRTHVFTFGECYSTIELRPNTRRAGFEPAKRSLAHGLSRTTPSASRTPPHVNQWLGLGFLWFPPHAYSIFWIERGWYCHNLSDLFTPRHWFT